MTPREARRIVALSLGGAMSIEGYVEYQRREYCKALPCPIQVLLDAEAEGSPRYEQIRNICKTSCIHTTYEFHHWLIQQGYQIVRPARAGEGQGDREEKRR